MLKDSEKFMATGGWAYENFNGDSNSKRDVPENGPISKCYECHIQKKDHDFVFSKLR
jgi:hypothetical protein